MLGRDVWIDLGIAAAVAGVAVSDLAGGGLHPAGAWAAGAAVTAVALTVRRRWPLPVLLAVIGAFLAASFAEAAEDPAYPFIAAVVATYSVGAYSTWRPAVAGLALVLGYFAIGSAADGNTSLGDVLFLDFFLLGAWVLGRALTGRTRYATALEHHAEQLEAEREHQAAAAVALERARIARELHDVIAHGVSLMVLQAGGVRRRLGDEQGREREALEAVEGTGREALGELHLLLGVLREDPEAPGPDEPAPGLGRLGALVESVRAAGLDVALALEGEPRPLPRALDVTAYRILQEALTNVVKHAHAGHVDVRVRYGRRRIELEVADDGDGSSGNGAGGGHGLVGMRERAALFGGELDTGPQPGGGYRVTARLPAEAGAA